MSTVASLVAAFNAAQFVPNLIYPGNALGTLRKWPAKVISCVMTSPPYRAPGQGC